MKTKDELREIVIAALNKCDGDKFKTREYLLAQADIDDDLMLGFAIHGKLIMETLLESSENTKH